jgi:hypothetical protein
MNMTKQTILRQVQETALAVYMYQQLYTNGIPTNVVAFEERAPGALQRCQMESAGLMHVAGNRCRY